MLLHIVLKRIPCSLIIADIVAVTANGQESAERFDFRQRLLKFLNNAITFFFGFFATFRSLVGQAKASLLFLLLALKWPIPGGFLW